MKPRLWGANFLLDVLVQQSMCAVLLIKEAANDELAAVRRHICDSELGIGETRVSYSARWLG